MVTKAEIIAALAAQAAKPEKYGPPHDESTSPYYSGDAWTTELVFIQGKIVLAKAECLDPLLVRNRLDIVLEFPPTRAFTYDVYHDDLIEIGLWLLDNDSDPTIWIIRDPDKDQAVVFRFKEDNEAVFFKLRWSTHLSQRRW
jgi:hypothetical protein